MVFENRVLRKTFDSRRDEVTGDWRQLHNEDPHNSYFSRSTIQMIPVSENEIGRRVTHTSMVWENV
jgi:hypothetical protein